MHISGLVKCWFVIFIMFALRQYYSRFRIIVYLERFINRLHRISDVIRGTEKAMVGFDRLCMPEVGCR